MLAAAKHFLANERDRAQAQKRGGGQATVSLSSHTADDQYSLEPAHELTAERIFEKRWAVTVLEKVLSRLHVEYVRKGQSAAFERLRLFLSGEKPTGSYCQIAAELSMTEAAVRQAVHRLRQRYGELLRSEIAQPVASPDDVEDELRDLLVALGS